MASSAVVFDFDSTVVKGKAKKGYDLDTLFGGHERILMLVRWLRRLKADLYICSGNSASLIKTVLDDLRSTGYDLDSSLFVAIEGSHADEKHLYVNALLERYKTVVFIDDTSSNYLELDDAVISIPMGGRFPMNEDHLMTIQAALHPRTNASTPKTPGSVGCAACGMDSPSKECNGCGTAYCDNDCFMNKRCECFYYSAPNTYLSSMTAPARMGRFIWWASSFAFDSSLVGMASRIKPTGLVHACISEGSILTLKSSKLM